MEPPGDRAAALVELVTLLRRQRQHGGQAEILAATSGAAARSVETAAQVGPGVVQVGAVAGAGPGKSGD